jgi:diguanylate cyclase (GGDEF)-like protein/PAS domain S-box-containing protein
MQPEPDVRPFARSALEDADVGFVVFRAIRHDGRIDWEVLDANAYVRRYWDPAQASGRRISTHADRVTRGALGAILERALTSSEPVEMDQEMDLPQGGKTWRRVRATRVSDDIVVTMTDDIGELVSARSRASALAQHSSDIVAITNVDAGLSWISPAVEGILGYRPEELVGGCTVDLVHPDDVALVVERFTTVSEDSTQHRTVELRLRSADGEYQWFLCSIANRVDDPEVRGIVMSMHDIDARRRSEDALRMSESRMRSILETAADAIITIDESGMILEFNKAAERIFRVSAIEVLGSRYADMLEGPEATVQLSDRTFGAATSGEPIELLVARADGEQFDARISVSSTTIEGRTLTTAIVRDVTKEKEAGRALEQRGLYDELTGLASRKLLIDRLAEAVRRAERRRSVVGVLLLDLDRFKHVNDSLGHDVGDALLVEVAHRLLVAAGGDTVARLGGDEFVVLCDEARDIDEISDRAGRLDEVLRAPFMLHGEEVMLTASIGIAVSRGGNERADELVRHADTAMYRAKREGRSAVRAG